MKTITCEDGKFVFVDGEKKVALLDVMDFMANKSRCPMQILSDGGLSIPVLISDLTDRHIDIGGESEEVFPYYLLDILATSYLIHSSVPVKVLEIGATSGILSYHLATLMGKLNKESLLCCVSNVIGNDSSNHWLDRISMVEEPPDLSLVISDYEATQLENGHFDIVILNGPAGFDKPYETVREAQRLVKKKGVLICHVKDTPLLESSFQLVFPERQEFEISHREKILAVTKVETAWQQEKPPVLEEEALELLRELRRIPRPGCHQEEMKPWIWKIDECVDMAMEYSYIDRKVELIRLKGKALDYMLNIGKEFEEYYRNDFMEYVCTLSESLTPKNA